MHVLKFLAVVWSLLCLVGLFIPWIQPGTMEMLGSGVVLLQIAANLQFVAGAWVFGLVALAAFKVIFTDAPEPAEHHRERVEPTA